MTIEMEEEPVSWFTIACLVTAVAVAFTYRFFGPDLLNPEAQEKKKKSEKTEQKEEVATPTAVVEEIPVPVVEKNSAPIVEAASAPVEEVKDSSDSSDFENISQSEIPPVEKAEKVETEPRDPSPAEEISAQESETLEETEEDIVKTMDLSEAITTSPEEVKKQPISVVDEAIDEFLSEKDEIVPEPVPESCQAPVNQQPEVDEPAEIIEQPVIPINVNAEPEIENVGPVEEPEIEEIEPVKEPETKTEIEPETEPKKEEPSLPKPEIEPKPEVEAAVSVQEGETLEDSIITGSFGDQTIMTPLVNRKLTSEPTKAAVIEEEIVPVQNKTEESVSGSAPQDIEKTIEDVAAQLIEDTLEQVKSKENLEDSGHAEDDSTPEAEIIKKNVTIGPDDIDSEIKARAEQLSEIADLVASSGMGEGVSVEEQSKLYLE